MNNPSINVFNVELEPEYSHDLECLKNLAGPVDPLAAGDSGGDSSADALFTDQSDSSRDNFNLFDPSFFGIDAANWPVDDVDDQDDDSRSSLNPEKLDQAEKRYLPFARKREGRQALKKITVDDFDKREERISFLAIEKHKIDLFGHKTNYAKRRAAVEWFFCHADDGGVTFDICAQILESRPDVIRLRIHYEFWLRWLVFSEEFPFMTVPLPEIIQGEILFNSSIEGLELAQEAWLQPGITTHAMLIKAAGVTRLEDVSSKYRKALDYLESSYTMSLQHDGWYLTGRNPLLQRLDLEKTRGRNIAGSSVHWSRLFYTPRV